MQDRRAPSRASSDGRRERRRLGRTVERHEPVRDHWANACRQGIGPLHARRSPLRGNRFLQCFDGTGVPRRVGRRADLGHALRATQLLELQRLVLHRQFMATLALAVEPLQDLGRKSERPAEEPTE